MRCVSQVRTHVRQSKGRASRFHRDVRVGPGVILRKQWAWTQDIAFLSEAVFPCKPVQRTGCVNSWRARSTKGGMYGQSSSTVSLRRGEKGDYPSKICMGKEASLHGTRRAKTMVRRLASLRRRLCLAAHLWGSLLSFGGVTVARWLVPREIQGPTRWLLWPWWRRDVTPRAMMGRGGNGHLFVRIKPCCLY